VTSTGEAGTIPCKNLSENKSDFLKRAIGSDIVMASTLFSRDTWPVIILSNHMQALSEIKRQKGPQRSHILVFVGATCLIEATRTDSSLDVVLPIRQGREARQVVYHKFGSGLLRRRRFSSHHCWLL
jgi:hypothetical protein